MKETSSYSPGSVNLSARYSFYDWQGNFYPAETVEYNSVGEYGLDKTDVFSRSSSENNKGNMHPSGGVTCRSGYTYELRAYRLRVPAVGSLAGTYFDQKTKTTKPKTQLIWAFRYVKVYSKKVKRRKVVDVGLLPNVLRYQGARTTLINAKTLISHKWVQDPRDFFSLRRIFTQYGDNWAGRFVFSNGTTSADQNFSNYTNSIINSQVFVDAEVEANAAALGKFYNYSKNQSVNLLQMVAERKQTAGLLLDAFKRLLKAALNVKRGNLVGAANALLPSLNAKGVANEALMIQYGIRPLLSDIDGIAKSLAIPEARSFDVVGKRRIDIPTTVLFDGYENCGFPLSCHLKVTTQGYVEVKYKARWCVESSLTRDFGTLGFSNLNTIAWELIPWSFVIDWFIKIGNYINLQDAFAGLVSKWATKTVYSKEQIVFLRTYSCSESGVTKTGFVHEKVNVKRDLLTEIPKIPFPSFKSPWSLEHFGNAVALATSFLKR